MYNLLLTIGLIHNDFGHHGSSHYLFDGKRRFDEETIKNNTAHFTWPCSYGFPHAIINIVVPESRVNNYALLGLIPRRTCNFHDESKGNRKCTTIIFFSQVLIPKSRGAKTSCSPDPTTHS